MKQKITVPDILTLKQGLECQAKVEAAIKWVSICFPMFATSFRGERCRSCRVKFNSSVPTANVGGGLIQMGRIVHSLTVFQTGFVLLHELFHHRLMHDRRRKELPDPKPDFETYNIAADLAINWLLYQMLVSNYERCFKGQGKQAAGNKDSKRIAEEVEALLDFGVFPGQGKYRNVNRGDSMENYVKLLMQDPPEPPPPQPDGSNDQDQEPEGQEDNKESGGDDNSQESGDPNESGDDQKDDGSSNSKPDGNKEESGGSQGRPDEEPGEGEEPGNIFGEICEDYADRAAEIDGDELNQTIKGFSKAGITYSTGILPRRSDVDWRPILKQWIQSCCERGMSFRRESKRHHLGGGMIMPGKLSNEKLSGCIIVDTSGSMNRSSFDQAMAEAEQIMMQFPNGSIIVYLCDDTVRLKQEVFASEMPIGDKVKWRGGRRTLIDKAFSQVIKEDRPEWILCITDMIWKFNECPDPGVPTMWLDVAFGFKTTSTSNPSKWIGRSIQEIHKQLPFGVYQPMTIKAGS